MTDLARISGMLLRIFAAWRLKSLRAIYRAADILSARIPWEGTSPLVPCAHPKDEPRQEHDLILEREPPGEPVLISARYVLQSGNTC